MMKQDTEAVAQGKEDMPTTADGAESTVVSKDDVDTSSSPKESETSLVDTPPQGDEATSEEAAAQSRCDKANELSRQLEDILNIYCRESLSDDAVANDQSRGSERLDDNGGRGAKAKGGASGVDKDQKKTHDKKKAKGLGKEITLLMQTLNTLSTPEEKLTGLCKKYAELLEEHRNRQKQMRALQKKQTQVVAEKDSLRSEHSKAILARSKLESLCRELQRHNRTLKEEGIQRTRLEEEKRKEVTSHVQVTLNDIQVQMEQHNERNASLRQENAELAEKLNKLHEQYLLREEHIEKVVKHKDLQQQLVDTKLQQAQELLKESEERHNTEKHFLLQEALESQRMCELMNQQEGHLKQQLSLYTEKFEEFQTTLSKSNEVFATFKQEMEKMTKKIKKLEKETAMYRSRWESSNKALVEMAQEKTVQDREFDALQGKVQRLEKLRRALKLERNELSKKVQKLSGAPAPPTSDSECPSPTPTDLLPEGSSGACASDISHSPPESSSQTSTRNLKLNTDKQGKVAQTVPTQE
ncbi:alpha-taxilin [Corythoichthys intestinalis]|uniref:alpha-taxilin n=1 Tax=Corythoichthys intestinalis TaxID=161448 RepID=UPI0025A51044|nr:alpha-taxilin [Corythoichthys intestinalis]XP_057684292.1 alpha-taxilin [Corythoichthys intestinalis]